MLERINDLAADCAADLGAVLAEFSQSFPSGEAAGIAREETGATRRVSDSVRNQR